MKLTVKEIIDIMSALHKVRMMHPMKYRDARQLNDLKKLFKERADLAADMERKLIETNGGEVDSRGHVKFPSSGAANAYIEEREKMFAETDDVDFVPVNLSAYVDYIEIDADTVDALDYVLILENKEGANSNVSSEENMGQCGEPDRGV